VNDLNGDHANWPIDTPLLDPSSGHRSAMLDNGLEEAAGHDTLTTGKL